MIKRLITWPNIFVMIDKIWKGFKKVTPETVWSWFASAFEARGVTTDECQQRRAGKQTIRRARGRYADKVRMDLLSPQGLLCRSTCQPSLQLSPHGKRRHWSSTPLGERTAGPQTEAFQAVYKFICWRQMWQMCDKQRCNSAVNFTVL